MFVQQYCCWFIIQTNEAQFLSKCYLLSDNEKLGGCIIPGYRQTLLYFSLSRSVSCLHFPLCLPNLIRFKSDFLHSSVTVLKMLPTSTFLKIETNKKSLLLERGQGDVNDFLKSCYSIFWFHNCILYFIFFFLS